MNILPKKRWHVRNKDNVARVRRDEQEAKEQADKLARRNQLAEKEAGINLLRSKVSKEKSGGDKEKSKHQLSGHINFFQELEDQSEAVVKSNPEYEAEKKAEKEAYEKKIGILTYLGQSVSKKEGEAAWYLQSSRKRKEIPGLDDKSDEKRKEMADPLQDVRKYLKKMKSKDGKEKESKRKSRKSKYKEVIESAKSSSSNIEELRAKRLKREQDERRKAELLIREKQGLPTQSDKTDDFYNPNRYSSQYNPEFVRKPREASRYQPY